MDNPELLSPSAVAATLIGSPSSAVPKPETETVPVPKPETRTEPVRGTETETVPHDKHGHPFRPGFHRVRADGSPAENRFGCYMPKGGRRTGIGTEAKPEPKPDAVRLTETVPVSEPSKPAWSEAERANAARPAGEQPGQPGQGAGSTPPQQSGPDTSEDTAEVAALALYFSVGAILNAHDEAQPPGDEHKSLVRVLASWIRSTGWRGSAGVCALLAVTAYALRVLRKPKSAAKVSEWLSELQKPKPRPVAPVPVSEPQPAAPAAVPPGAIDFGAFRERPAR